MPKLTKGAVLGDILLRVTCCLFLQNIHRIDALITVLLLPNEERSRNIQTLDTILFLGDYLYICYLFCDKLHLIPLVIFFFSLTFDASVMLFLVLTSFLPYFYVLPVSFSFVPVKTFLRVFHHGSYNRGEC